MEINQITNHNIKEKLADTAISLLLNKQSIIKEELPYIKVHFGYVFTKEDGVLEALFKIMTQNNTVYYFALQKNEMMMININESLYQATITNMKQLHPCLTENL